MDCASGCALLAMTRLDIRYCFAGTGKPAELPQLRNFSPTLSFCCEKGADKTLRLTAKRNLCYNAECMGKHAQKGRGF